MQKEHFKKRGLSLDNFHLATLNLSIIPYFFEIIKADYTFNNVKWTDTYPSENFSFVKCKIKYDNKDYDALIYYPHLDTKITHLHKKSTIEVISEYIPNVKYQDHFILKIDTNKINIYAQE